MSIPKPQYRTLTPEQPSIAAWLDSERESFEGFYLGTLPGDQRVLAYRSDDKNQEDHVLNLKELDKIDDPDFALFMRQVKDWRLCPTAENITEANECWLQSFYDLLLEKTEYDLLHEDEED